MTLYSKVIYDDQDYGRILKAARNQQYTIFPAPIALLNGELKEDLGMKTKKEEDEDEVQFLSLKVPIDAANKEFKTYTIKIQKSNMGSTEGLLKWRTPLNKQIKNNGFTQNYEMVMNLAQAMLAGCSLDGFMKERRAQEVKNKTRLAKNITVLTPHQIYDYAIFDLEIRAFDTQSGSKDTFERQREYTKRNIFMGKLNPEKFS
jgi:hypothetical protein